MEPQPLSPPQTTGTPSKRTPNVPAVPNGRGSKAGNEIRVQTLSRL